MPDILIPARSADDWQHFLAGAEKHLSTGLSAKALAYCWQAARDFPRSVRTVFKQSPYPRISRRASLESYAGAR